jgi:hypothetical protein
MKLIDDIRRENMACLRDELGSIAKLAKVLERSESHISQWIHGLKNSGTGKPRNMRSDTARWIERMTGKSVGWLDIDHGKSAKVVQFDGEIFQQYQAANYEVRMVVDIALGRIPITQKTNAIKIVIDSAIMLAKTTLDAPHRVAAPPSAPP